MADSSVPPPLTAGEFLLNLLHKRPPPQSDPPPQEALPGHVDRSPGIWNLPSSENRPPPPTPPGFYHSPHLGLLGGYADPRHSLHQNPIQYQHPRQQQQKQQQQQQQSTRLVFGSFVTPVISESHLSDHELSNVSDGRNSISGSINVLNSEHFRGSEAFGSFVTPVISESRISDHKLKNVPVDRNSTSSSTDLPNSQRFRGSRSFGPSNSTRKNEMNDGGSSLNQTSEKNLSLILQEKLKIHDRSAHQEVVNPNSMEEQKRIFPDSTEEREVTLEDSMESSEIKSTNSSRKKDYRADFSRGHHVSSQRVRYRRQEIRCRHDITSFTPQLMAIYESLTPPEEEKLKQRQLLQYLQKLVTQEWPDARLHLYGSCANSFGASNSDIDVCLQIPDLKIEKAEILLRLAEILESNNLQDVQALTRARVPIAKLKDPATNICCDICINNILAVVNTKLLRDYSQIDHRLRQLVFIVKHWAKARNVNDTYQGTLSSYAYVLMCIHFLQMRRPAILPCLQGMQPTYVANVESMECAFFDQVDKLRNFGSRNREDIAELLWGFFNYWAYHHDYTNDVISIRTGGLIRKQSKDWTRRIGNDRHLICIEDPFELSHDLGRVVDKFTIKILREEFERAADIMQFDPHPVIRLFEPYVPPSIEQT